MLALAPEENGDGLVLERFLMLLVRGGTGLPEDVLPGILPGNPEDAVSRASEDRAPAKGDGSLREDP